MPYREYSSPQALPSFYDRSAYAMLRKFTCRRETGGSGTNNDDVGR
jgi:hypothetical protein